MWLYGCVCEEVPKIFRGLFWACWLLHCPDDLWATTGVLLSAFSRKPSTVRFQKETQDRVQVAHRPTLYPQTLQVELADGLEQGPWTALAFVLSLQVQPSRAPVGRCSEATPLLLYFSLKIMSLRPANGIGQNPVSISQYQFPYMWTRDLWHLVSVNWNSIQSSCSDTLVPVGHLPFSAPCTGRAWPGVICDIVLQWANDYITSS